YIGGLAGIVSGVIKNTYADGAINGANGVTGGLVGLLTSLGSNTSIYNSYSAVTSGANTKLLGGLIGQIIELEGSVTCSDSYWDMNKSKTDLSAGCKDGGRTTYDMQHPDRLHTYTNWVDDIWNIRDGGYPTLKNMPPSLYDYHF
ncbi:MAG: hypothetical protein K0R94_818, partial [Burkholderiales bacterium]|nr:hypothetical protein [Burkholderiales bacterium]